MSTDRSRVTIDRAQYAEYQALKAQAGLPKVLESIVVDGRNIGVLLEPKERYCYPFSTMRVGEVFRIEPSPERKRKAYNALATAMGLAGGQFEIHTTDGARWISCRRVG